MIQYKQGIEFIDYVRSFHHLLSQYYSKLKNNSQKEKVKMILDYLVEHESKMESTLLEFEDNISSKVGKFWFSFIENNKLPECFKQPEMHTEMTIDEVLEKAIRFDECLIALYKHLSDYASIPEVKSFFESMADMESHEMRNVIRNIQRIDDM